MIIANFFKDARQSFLNNASRMQIDLIVFMQVLNNIVEVVMSVIYYAPTKSPAWEEIGLRNGA